MQPSDWRERLIHIQDAIRRIFRHVQGLDFDGFADDEKTIDAVVRNLEIIGEAVRFLPEEFQAANPELPWRNMMRMRNRLIRGYFDVDITVVWETVNEDLPPLPSLIQEILESVEDPE